MKPNTFLKSFLLFLTLVLFLLSRPVVSYGVIGVYGFRGLNGADPALQAINTTGMDNGSYAVGTDSNGWGYMYYFNSSSSAAAVVPGVIDPTTGPGRWILVPRFYAETFYSNVADLSRYLNVSNTSTPNFTPSDGDFYTRTDTGISYLYNAADSEYVPNLNSKISNIPASPGSGSQTLLTRHMYGCFINNINATGSVTYVVPKAGYGMQFTVYLAAAQIVDIDPNSSDRIYPTCNNNGDRLRHVGTAGMWVTLKSMFLPSDNDYNWYIVSIHPSANWTDND